MGAQLALDQPEGAPAAPLTANTASRQLVPARAPPAPGSGSPGAQATAAAECSALEPRPRDGLGSRSVPTVSGAQPRRSQRSALVAPAPADALPVAPAVAATAATPTPRVAPAPAGDDLSPGPSPPASQRQRARPTPARDAGGVSGSAGASGSAGGQRQRGTARPSQRVGGRRQRGGRDGRANPRAHAQPGARNAPPAPQPPGPSGQRQQHGRARIPQNVPATARADWSGAVTRALEDVADAVAHASGGGAQARLSEALDAVARLPERVLADRGAQRSRARRVLARLRRIAEGQHVEEEVEGSATPVGARRRRMPEQERLAARIQRHLSAGSIRRGARALEAEPLADTTDPGVLEALRALHPPADPPAVLAAEEPALQVSASALCAVLGRVSAHNRGTAGGPTGWTYEMICAAAYATEDGLRAVLRFVNLILAGALPRDSFILRSSLVGLQKPGGGVRPIAIGEAWYRLAMLCALTEVGSEVGASLAPLQVGVGTRGGVDAVAHAISTALAADPQSVLLSVDMANAFNTVSRDAVLGAVRERMPQLLPVVQWAYGSPSALHVVSAPEGTEPVLSRCGVRQGDPLGPLLFALALHRSLERAAADEPTAAIIAYLDDCYIVGQPDTVQRVFRKLCGQGEHSVQGIGLRVRPSKCGVHGGDAAELERLARTLGVRHMPDGITVVGVPLGSESYRASALAQRSGKVVRLVRKLRTLPLATQSQFLLLRASLSTRLAHLQRTVEWATLAPATRQLEQAVLAAAAGLFKLPAGLGPGDLSFASGPELKQLQLPIRHGGFGLRAVTEVEAHAAFLSGAASAHLVLAEGPEQFRPLAGARRAPLLALWQQVFDDCGTECRWPQQSRTMDASAIRDVLPLAQRDVGRCLGDRQGAAFLDGCDLDTPDGKRAAARLRSAAGAVASAWLITTPGETTALGDTAFVVGGRHRLGLGVPTTVSPPPCLCGAGCAASPDHAMVCKGVAKMTQMRHDIVASAVRRVVCRSSCSSSSEPSYRHLRASAQQGNATGMHRGDVLVVLPDGELSIMDIVVTHPAANSAVDSACSRTGAAAHKAEEGKKRAFRRHADAGQYAFVPFAVESFGCLGASAQSFLKRLGEVAASQGRIDKSAFVRSAYREISVALQRGNGLMYGKSLFAIARASGRSFLPGLDVPVQEACRM